MEVKMKFKFLRNHNLFSQLNETEINQLYLLSEYKIAKKDEIIYSINNEIDRIYILGRGRIKIAYSIKKNEEIVSEILKEGDIFGDLRMKRSANTHCEFAQVLSDEAMICSFKIEIFDELLKKYSGISIAFSQMLAEKLRIISRKYSDLVFKDVRSRVLNFFNLHAQYEGKWTGSKVEIKMYCTHQDIANFTGSTRQTVSTIINNLVKEKKIIYESRTRLTIPDIEGLKI